jgi:hypothetical protein
MLILARFFRVLIGIGLISLGVVFWRMSGGGGYGDYWVLFFPISLVLVGSGFALESFKKKSAPKKTVEVRTQSGTTLGTILGFLAPIPVVLFPCIKGPVCGEAPLGLIIICPITAVLGGILGRNLIK